MRALERHILHRDPIATALMSPEESSPEHTRSITMLNVYAGLV